MSKKINAPIPMRLGESIRSQAMEGIINDSDALRSMTPNTTKRVQNRRPSYSSIEVSRESHYNLDYPDSYEQTKKLNLDKSSRFYARDRPRTLDLQSLLPYETELPKDQAKFLSHIVSHLYIAIKTLDIQGSLSVSAKDLAALKNVSGLSDLDIALDTNLFEMDSSGDGAVFSQDEDPGADLDYSDDEDEDDDQDDDDDRDDEDDEEEEEEDEAEEESAHDTDRNETASQHKKSPKSAAVVGVRIWTNELLVWLKMKYEMPLSLRIALIKVYYSICLCRGQYLSLRFYVKAFDLLTKNILLLKENGLQLPWEELSNELINHFPNVDSSIDNFEKKDLKQLLRLAEKASNFFDPKALPQIYDKLGQHFAISSASLVISSMNLLPLVFGNNDLYDIRYYIPSFFYIWEKFHKNNDLDAYLTAQLGNISLSALINISKGKQIELGDFGIFSESQFKILLNNLLNNLNISPKKFSSKNSNYYHGYSSVIVNSINGDIALQEDGILNHLSTLVNAIESYAYPTNQGEWTKSISKLIFSLIHHFHRRYNLEQQEYGYLYDLPASSKLSKNVVDKFVKIFLPIVRTGLQSKRSSAVDNYLSSLGLLAYLNPEYVLEGVLLDLYESLTGMISTHRVNVAIRALDELARYFSTTKIFRVHVTKLLSLALNGIDSNDLNKTLITLNLFETFATFIPFKDLTDSGDEGLAFEFTQVHLQYLTSKSELEDVEFDSSNEVECLKSSTVAFESLILGLIDKVFTLLENLPDPIKSGRLERSVSEALPKFLHILFESIGEEIFVKLRTKIFDFVFNNTIYTVADTMAEICGSVIKHEPKSFRKYGELLIDRIKDNIEDGSGTSRTGSDIIPRDQPLFWNLVILNECIGNANTHVLELGKPLKDLVYFLLENVKGPSVFASAYIINQILQSITKIRMTETRLISPSYIAEHGIDEKCWGGFQFSEERFKPENLEFDWYLPTDKEVGFAIDFFTEVTSKLLENISNLMKGFTEGTKRDLLETHGKSEGSGVETPKISNGEASVALTDDLRNNFMYLSYALSGISFLLDPSFEEDIPKLNHDQETIQQRLLLLKQIRSVKDEKLSGKDELRIENLQENLQKIIEDMGNERSDSNDMGPEQQMGGEMGPEDEAQTMEVDEEKPEENDEDKSDDIDKPMEYSKSHLFEIERSNTPENNISRASPGIEGVSVSQMNPGITFRERKLYTSKYFFGDDMEARKSKESYIKLHRYRYIIGRSLHIISKFLSSHFGDNTKLFKHFLYTLNMWFSDVGRERLLDNSHAKIDYGVLSSTQDINRVKKPFTRITIGARIESYHSLRVALHATSRTQTDLDKLLLEDLVKISLSTYSTVSKPAQATLIDAMKRLNGSYNIIIKSSLKYLTKALDDNNEKRIESGLNLFNLRRIKHKIQNDYFNLNKFIGLLQRCLLIDKREVTTLATTLFKGIYKHLTPPSSVCIIDLSAVDQIRPPDEFIDLEIKAVKLAKEKKRQLYLEKLTKLESHIISHETNPNFWKVSLLNLSLLIDLQLDLEIPNNKEIFKILVSKAANDHPIICKLAIKGITKLINKVYVSQLLDYELENAHDFDYLMKDFEYIDTTKDYYKEWRQEMKKDSNSDYFIDSKATNGWLFWGKKMKVVKSQIQNIQLSDSDLDTIRYSTSMITKDWFHNIIKLWVTDNEINSAYQATDVYFTETIVFLISNSLLENFQFHELLEVIELVYEKDDKSSHIVCCELLAGLLLSSKISNPQLTIERDQFIVKFLSNILENDLSPDTSGIWNVFSWWIPAHIDHRRFPEITNLIVKYNLDKESDFAIRDASRLGYIKSFIASTTWKFNDPHDILDMCIEFIDHQYQAVRDQIGSLLSMLTYIYYPDSIQDFQAFNEACNSDTINVVSNSNSGQLKNVLPEIFKSIETWRIENIGLSPQELLKTKYIYTSSTVLTWLKQSLGTSISIYYQDFIVDEIVPFLLNLINLKEVCQLGNIDPISVLKLASQIPFSISNIDKIVKMLEHYATQENLNVVQSIVIGEFTETFYFKNLFKLTPFQRSIIINFTNKLLYHKQVSVREHASSTLSGLIHISPPKEVETLVQVFSKTYRQKLDKVRSKYKRNYKNIDPEDLISLHGSTLGLGSLIHAFSFLSPPPKWVPELLTILVNKSSGIPGLVGKTAKDSLSKFKKTRQDTWHIDSQVFNESQIQDLEGVLIKSYFI